SALATPDTQGPTRAVHRCAERLPRGTVVTLPQTRRRHLLGGINFNTAGQAGSHPAAKRLSGRRRSGIGISLAALSLCGAAVIAGPEGSASAAATTPATSKALQVPHVAWSGCPAGQPGLTGFRCATIEVPLDYAD